MAQDAAAAVSVLEYEPERLTDQIERYVDRLYERQIFDQIPPFKGESSADDEPTSSDTGTRLAIDPLPADIEKRLRDNPGDIASFTALQEWDGYILEVTEDTFRARLIDLTNKTDSHVEEEVEISLNELDDESQSRLSVGTLLRWSIGYQRARSGQKTRVSKIIIRRLPVWREEEIQAAKRKALERSQKLEWK